MRIGVVSAFAKYHPKAVCQMLQDNRVCTPKKNASDDTVRHVNMASAPHAQVVLNAEHLLQFHMARDSSDSSLQYPTRYLAEDNTTFDIDVRLNRYIAQTQVGW